MICAQDSIEYQYDGANSEKFRCVLGSVHDFELSSEHDVARIRTTTNVTGRIYSPGDFAKCISRWNLNGTWCKGWQSELNHWEAPWRTHCRITHTQPLQIPTKHDAASSITMDIPVSIWRWTLYRWFPAKNDKMDTTRMRQNQLVVIVNTSS